MKMSQVKKEGTFFVHDGREFYDVLTGPGATKCIVADANTLGIRGSDEQRYRYGWYYDSNQKDMNRTYAAQILANQFRYILVDHKGRLLRKDALNPKGNEVGFDVNVILFGETNAKAHGATV